MENQRIRLSKMLLKNALLKLLKEKPLHQISVYEICETAQINRTTFYKYYGSQRELLQEIEADFFAQLNTDMEDIVEQNPHAMIQVLEDLYEQRETFCILVQAVPPKDFTAQLFAIPSLGRIFQNLVDASHDSETTVRYVRQFVQQGAFSVLCVWLESDQPEPVAEIAEIFGLLRSKLSGKKEFLQ